MIWPFRRRKPATPDSLLQSDPANDLYRLFLERGTRAHKTAKWHHYFDIYDAFLARYRGQSPTLLEIGVDECGSLEIWREWLGPGARIFGMDINPKSAELAPPGTKVFIGDQADPAFLRQVLAEIGTPDIVVDDGGHTSNQQINSFEVFYPAMAPDGVYMVEDTHTALWGGQWDDRPGMTFLDYAAERVKDLHAWSGIHANFRRYHTHPGERVGEEAEVPEFTRATRAISFFDSIVAFERGPRREPWQERR